MGFKEVPEHFPKPHLHQNKIMATYWWSAAHLIHYSSLNPSETVTPEKHAQQINEMHWKLQCLQAGIGQQNGHNSSLGQCPTTCHTVAQCFERIGLWNFSSSTTFTWVLANLLPLLQVCQQHFAGKMLSQLDGCRKHFPRIHWILRHGFIFYRNKQTYFSLAKMCWL